MQWAAVRESGSISVKWGSDNIVTTLFSAMDTHFYDSRSARVTWVRRCIRGRISFPFSPPNPGVEVRSGKRKTGELIAPRPFTQRTGFEVSQMKSRWPCRCVTTWKTKNGRPFWPPVLACRTGKRESHSVFPTYGNCEPSQSRRGTAG